MPGEEFEYERLYQMMSEYALEHHSPLAQQAYQAAAAAEKEHAALLKKAAGMETYKEEAVYVCPICGYVMTSGALPERCPVCGGPKRQFEVFGNEEKHQTEA